MQARDNADVSWARTRFLLGEILLFPYGAQYHRRRRVLESIEGLRGLHPDPAHQQLLME
jgi:hypothetical protein